MTTLQSAARDIRSGRITPVELLDQCLGRIDTLEARVHAWVLVDRERARADAERLTAELRNGQYRGPLHGLPIGIKDIFDVFDWPTGCGSKKWAGSIARRDATVVERLRRAGAVFPGKTVTTLFASFDPPVTRNPWNVAHTPGGSSSGSAAAVACGMCLAAMGSQTGGSITRPATYCGVAGLKPTYGRVSGDGVMPLAPSMDHPGPIARTVADLALLLQAVAGHDARDHATSVQPVPDYSAALTFPSTAPRLGRVRGLFADLADPPVRDLMDQVANKLSGRGAAVIDVSLPAAFSEVVPRHRVVMAVEGAAYHRERLRRYPDDYGPAISALLEEGIACPATEYARCKEHQISLSREMESCLEGVDALLTPATTGPAPDATTTGNPAFNSPWSYTGLPTVSFPAGRAANGLPLAVQLVGKRWGEADLLRTAAWCEQTMGFDVGEVPE